MVSLTPLARRLAPCFATLLWCLAPCTAIGQSGSGATSAFLNPSLSSLGMGQAGAALYWEDDRNDWANPALLGYESGMRYSHGRYRLIPELASDVYFEFDRMALGAWGVGVSIAGKPVDDFGGYRLDYGLSEATDTEGNVIGTFRSFEEVRQIGVGISLLRFYDSVRRHSGRDPIPLSRTVDLSVGHAWKSVLVDLAPASVTLDGIAARGEVSERDLGLLLRLTPIGAHRESRPGPLGFRLDTAAALSKRNYGDNRLVYIDPDQSDPVTEERVVAVSGQLRVLLPTEPSVIWDFLTPHVAIAGTWEQARFYDDGVRVGGHAIDRTGQEIDLMGIGFLRRGFVDDPAGGIHDETKGWGVRLQYRGIVGARYDWAEVPQSSFLKRLERKGFTVFFDPCRLLQAAKRGEGDIAQR